MLIIKATIRPPFFVSPSPPSHPRRGALHPYSFRLVFRPLDVANSLVFKHISEYYFLNYLFRDQVLQVTPRTAKDMKYLEDLLLNRYNFEVV